MIFFPYEMLLVQYEAVTAGVNEREFLVSIAINYQLLCCCELGYLVRCLTGKTRHDSEGERYGMSRQISNFGK